MGDLERVCSRPWALPAVQCNHEIADIVEPSSREATLTLEHQDNNCAASRPLHVLVFCEKWESGGVEAFVTGENRLLSQPEFRDPDKAHKLMNYLADGGHVIADAENGLFDDSSEVRVLIGPENVAEELKDSSVVIASYDMGDNTKGLIGVVGPTRMDYSAVAAKLSILAAGLSRRLGSGETPPEGMHNKLIIKGDDHNEQG